MRWFVGCLLIMGAGLAVGASGCSRGAQDYEGGFAGVPLGGSGGQGGTGGMAGRGGAGGGSERGALCRAACTTLVDCFLEPRQRTSPCEVECEGIFPSNERCTRCVAEAADCDRASLCQAYCLPDACQLDGDCPDGSACVELDGTDGPAQGLCMLAECTGDEACGEGRYCTAPGAGRYCRDIECEKDGDCADSSATCQDHVCLLPECEVDAHCPADLACRDQRCAFVECAADEDCRAGAFCDFGYCRLTECEANADCRPEELCEGHLCTPRACRTAGDCPDGMLCGEACYVPECTRLEDCTDLYGPGFTCAVDRCERDFSCEDSSACLRDEECRDGTCERNWVCEGDGDCRAYAKEICRDGGCERDLSCAADTDCFPSELCLSGRCY